MYNLVHLYQNSGLFLAGIIQSGLNLVPDDPTFARVGESQATNSNDTPQSGKTPSITGDAETAIWSYSANTNELKVQWVNYNNGKPATDIMYDFATNTLYLTDNPDGVADGHPLALVVVCILFFFSIFNHVGSHSSRTSSTCKIYCYGLIVTARYSPWLYLSLICNILIISGEAVTISVVYHLFFLVAIVGIIVDYTWYT